MQTQLTVSVPVAYLRMFLGLPHLTLDNQSGGSCLETNSPSLSNCKLLVAPHLGVGFCDILPSLSGCQLVL